MQRSFWRLSLSLCYPGGSGMALCSSVRRSAHEWSGRGCSRKHFMQMAIGLTSEREEVSGRWGTASVSSAHVNEKCVERNYGEDGA